MKPRCIVSFLIVLFASLTLISSASGQDKFRLKPGAKGKLCLSCHEEFKEKLKRPFIHTPVKSGDCSDCHNPHSSRYGKLIAADPNKICFSCHDRIASQDAKSSHKVVASGNCIK